VGYYLGNSIVLDMAQKEFSQESLQLLKTADCWAIEAGTNDTKLRSMLESLNVRHKAITGDQLPLAKINPTHTVFVNCWDESHVDRLEEEAIQKLINFVNSGGQLVTFNAGLRLLEKAFPGFVAASDRQVLDYLNIPITVVAKDDISFKGYQLLTLECVVEPGCRGIKILDKVNVIPLATIPARYVGERVAAVKFSVGHGHIIHIICELCERERVSSNPETTIMPYLKRIQASPVLIQAWKCAGSCGFQGSWSVAQAAFPLMYFIACVLVNHKLRVIPQVELPEFNQQGFEQRQPPDQVMTEPPSENEVKPNTID